MHVRFLCYILNSKDFRQIFRLHTLVAFVQFKNVKSTHGGVLLLVKSLILKKPATLLQQTQMSFKKDLDMIILEMK